MDPVSDWEALSRELNLDRRSGKRVHLRFPIEVSGFTRAGSLFTERTQTSDISESGCRFTLNEPVKRDDVVAIKLLRHHDNPDVVSRAELFQIVWRERGGKSWFVGALKLRDDKFWEVSFPPKLPPES